MATMTLKRKKSAPPAKFKALVHYVIAKAEPSRLGSVCLNKILWYLDTLSYRATGTSITGETYIKRQHGPVPKHVLAVLGELEHEQAIVIRNRERFGYPMTDFISVKDPHASLLKLLSAADMEMADDVRQYICDEHTAASISELSHDQIWEAANIGEEIPLAASLAAAPGEVTDELLKWADSVRSRYEAVNQARS